MMTLASRIAALGSACIALLAFAAGAAALPQGIDRAMLLRGEQLATAADCNACHRSPQAGGADYAGGLPLASPMGEIIGPNITPSVKYGIGQYSEADFRRALVDGVRRDGRYLYPAMPYTAYRGISESDLHALYAYFMYGVEPVEHEVAPTSLAFPFSIRQTMWFWNVLYREQPKPVTNLDSDALKNGYYLVEVLGHCSVCHSPRNFLMAEDNGQRFAGGSIGGWYAPNITSDKVSGIGGWSDEELTQYLKTGHVQGKGAAAGGMGEAVEYSLSEMPGADLQDMVTYLRHVPAVRNDGEERAAWQHGSGDRPSDGADNEAGQKLYASACAACHRLQGEGAYADHFPSLTHNTTTGSLRADNMVMVILDGVNREGEFTPVTMPGFRGALSDKQIAQLSNYIAQRFGNPALNVTDAFVAMQRSGGEMPPIMRLLPWAYGIAIVIVLGGLALWLRKCSASKKQGRP